MNSWKGPALLIFAIYGPILLLMWLSIELQGRQ